jgi:hypothetical protein
MFWEFQTRSSRLLSLHESGILERDFDALDQESQSPTGFPVLESLRRDHSREQHIVMYGNVMFLLTDGLLLLPTRRDSKSVQEVKDGFAKKFPSRSRNYFFES